MNINELRTPEGLNHYLNVVLKKLPIKPPEKMLQVLFWQKIKNDFLVNGETVNQLFVDDKENILVIEVNNIPIKSIIGYLHLPDTILVGDQDSNASIIKVIKEFEDDFRKLISQNSWNQNQVFLISTFKLSGIPNLNLDKFPNQWKYMFLDNQTSENKNYEIAMDEDLNLFAEGDIMLKEFMRLGKNL